MKVMTFEDQLCFLPYNMIIHNVHAKHWKSWSAETEEGKPLNSSLCTQ